MNDYTNHLTTTQMKFLGELRKFMHDICGDAPLHVDMVAETVAIYWVLGCPPLSTFSEPTADILAHSLHHLDEYAGYLADVN